MDEQNTIDTLVALITEWQIKIEQGQIKADEQNRELLALITEQNREFRLAFEQDMQSLRQEFKLVNQKLDRIQSNTVTIMGVFPETLAELEATSEPIEPFTEVLEDCVEKIKKGGTVSVADCVDTKKWDSRALLFVALGTHIPQLLRLWLQMGQTGSFYPVGTLH